MERASLVVSLVDLISHQGLVEDLLVEIDQRGMIVSRSWRDELRQVLREELATRPQAVPTNDGFMTVKQAAEHAGVKASTIRAWIAQDKVVAAKAGRQWRVRREDLERCLVAGKDNKVDINRLAADIVALDRRRKR
jgi:excisionase family DNA binding protein